MVSYIAVVGQFQLSVNTCKERGKRGANDYWSAGVAFFVGSIDTSLGTSSSEEGVLLHSLGVEQCSKFDKCNENGESLSNEALMIYFEKGRDFLKDGRCDEVQSILDSNILPLLQIPIVQGTLYHSIPNNSVQEPNADISTVGYILAQSILPVVDDANKKSGQTIADIFHSPSESSLPPEDTEAVFEAVKYALPKMDINCGQVGHALDRPDLSLCVEYIFPTSFQNHANIGLDVAEMTRALMDGQIAIAQKIYVDGMHSVNTTDETGETKALPSLQSFSTDLTSAMLDDPLFNIFLHTFSKGKSGPEFDESLAYGDHFVQEAFQTVSDSSNTLASKTLAVEAAVALNVWMYIAHLLHKTLAYCKSPKSENGNATRSIDEAAAYWIGNAEIGTADKRGHLLYALADQMDGYFETSTVYSLSVNQDMLSKFADAKNMLLQPDACSPDSYTFTSLYSIVNEMISLMTVTSVQGLIHNIRTNDRDRVRMFAHAVVPMIAVCNPIEYEFLQAELLKDEYNVVDTATLVERIYSVLPCLGLSCGQVGVHFSEMVDENKKSRCADVLHISSIAGYRPVGEFYKVCPVLSSLFTSLYVTILTHDFLSVCSTGSRPARD
jgi:hypothetical protein